MAIIGKRRLGRTGLMVSEMGFGGWAIGGHHYGEIDDRTAKECVRSYLEAGGNFIDTAQFYKRSERIIGDVLSERNCRDNVYIMTKLMGETLEDLPNLRVQLENSLRALRTDYVDVCLFHQPPTDVDVMNRWFDEFETFRAEGKIRFIGASIYKVNVTPETIGLCRRYIQTGRADVVMLVYSILRQLNEQVFDECREADVGIVVRSVLESGFLTGTITRDHEFSKTDHRTRWSRGHLGRILDEVQAIQAMVAPPYSSVSQLAIGFARHAEAVSSAVIGVESSDNVRENTAAFHLPFPEAGIIERLKTRYGDFTPNVNVETQW